MYAFGFSARHWQQIEAGRPITVVTLLRICQAFKISAARLLRGLDTPPNIHAVQFYSDDASLLRRFARFIAAALKHGNSAVVLTTKSHRDLLSQRLRMQGIDVDGLAQAGTFVSLDANIVLSRIMMDGSLNLGKFSELLRTLVNAAAKAARTRDRRVAICAECVGILSAKGNVKAAIHLEDVGNHLIKSHNVDILCAYPATALGSNKDNLAKICAAHSAVYFG